MFLTSLLKHLFHTSKEITVMCHVVMLVAMICILLFNHYDSFTGMVPKTLDCVLCIESAYNMALLNTTAETIQCAQ